MEKMNNHQLLELLKTDVDKFNQYRKENPDQQIDFSDYGAHFYRLDLRNANLRDAYLSDANLRDAYLSGANLSGANLRDANLKYADLRGANLRDTDARGANFSWACLARADIQLMKIYSSQKNTIILSLGLLEHENE